MEVLINILLTAIILGMVYFIYVSFVQQIALFEENSKARNNVDIFSLQLKTDFFKAERIINAPNSFKVIFYDLGEVHYTIGQKFLYRKQKNRMDSLEIVRISREWTLKANSQEQLLHSLDVEALLFQNPVSFSVFKEYPFINSNAVGNGN